jgi:hypothetical protein
MPLFAKVDYEELSSSGLKQSGGIIYEEFLPRLRGRLGRRVYEEMRSNDDAVSALLYSIDMLLRQVEWYVQPASDDNVDVERADFVSSCIDDMSHSWGAHISESLTMLPFGFAPHEIVWKQRKGIVRDSPGESSRYVDGRWGIRKLPLIGQSSLDRWEFDSDGGLAGLWQAGNTFVPIQKMLLYRPYVEKNNPEGRSILRGAWQAWYFKKKIMQLEAIGLERDLVGYPVGYLDASIMRSTDPTHEEIVRDIESIIYNIRRDELEGALFPLAYDEDGNPLFKFELLASGGQRQFDLNATIQRYDRAIVRTGLADFLMLGGGESAGSYALSKDKTELFELALTTHADSIADVLNRHLVPRLMEANGWMGDYPEIRHGPVERMDYQALAAFLKDLSVSGADVFPDDGLENFLRRSASLPEKEIQ